MSAKRKDPLALTELKKIEDIEIAIIQSKWNRDITDKLRDSAYQTLVNNGVLADNILEVQVPGTFELGYGAKTVIAKKSPDAVICLGCVIKGETDHDIYISQAVANSLSQLSMLSNVPVLFGVLTTNNEDQALQRAGGTHGNKGAEAAESALELLEVKQALDTEKKTIGFHGR